MSSVTEPEELVWHNTVDNGTWDCRVVHNSNGTGTLYVTHVAEGTVVLEEVVTLAYGAVFGPDVGDVQEWEARCIAAIDTANGATT